MKIKTKTIVLWATIFAFSCQGKEGRRPYSYDIITLEASLDGELYEDTSQAPLPKCTIQKPQANRILTGPVEVRVVVSDPKGRRITRVIFAFLVPGSAPVILGDIKTIPPDGTITEVVDSKKVSDGDRSFLCQVENEDGLKGASAVPVKVDNTPPTVALDSRSTPPSSNFLSDLYIGLWVNDGNGVGTNHVVVKVNGTAVADLVKPKNGQQPLITVGSHDLVVGKNTVEITADDLAGNVMPSPLSYWVSFVPPVSLESPKASSLPQNILPSSILAIETAKGPSILAVGPNGLWLLSLDSIGNIVVSQTLALPSTTKAIAKDVNDDGLDDLIVATSEGAEQSTIQVFLQGTSGQFPSTPAWKGTLSGRVNALDARDLNNDGIPDLVALLEKATGSLAVSLSKKGNSPQWNAFQTYGGVDSPHLLVIGDFTGDGQDDILVARRGSPVVTVFPVDKTTSNILVGVNSTLQATKGPGTVVQFSSLSDAVRGPKVSGGKGSTAYFLDSNLAALVQIEPDPNLGYGAVTVTSVTPTGLNPTRLLRTDLDEDGIEDLVVLSRQSAMITVYWGAKDGSLEEGQSLLAGNDPSDMCAASWSGHSEIVALDWASKQVLRFVRAEGANKRRFSGPNLVRVGARPLSITAGRYLLPLPSMPNHKDLAVLVSESGGSFIAFLVSDEATNLPTKPALAMEKVNVSSPVDMISADLDKNGYDDLLIPSMAQSSTTSSPTMGRKLLTQGISHLYPSFVKNVTDPVTGLSANEGLYAGNSPSLAVVADLKREASKPGVLDMAVIAKFERSGKQVLLFQPFVGKGDGTFTMQEGVLYPVDESLKPSALAAARLTGGSNYDVVVTFAQTGEFSIFYAKGLGLFAAGEGEAPRLAVGNNPKRIAIEAMGAPLGSNLDLYPDIVVLLDVDVAIVNAIGKEGDKMLYDPPVYLGHTGRGPEDLAIKDMNGDGYPDILVLDRLDRMVSIHLNLAQGRFSEPFRFLVGVNPVRMAVADLDGDGCEDVATADGDGKTVTILRNLGCSGQ